MLVRAVRDPRARAGGARGARRGARPAAAPAADGGPRAVHARGGGRLPGRLVRDRGARAAAAAGQRADLAGAVARPPRVRLRARHLAAGRRDVRARPGAGARRARTSPSRLRDDSPGSGRPSALPGAWHDRRAARAVAGAARGRRPVPARARQRSARRSRLRAGRRRHRLARTGSVGLRRGAGARVLSRRCASESRRCPARRGRLLHGADAADDGELAGQIATDAGAGLPITTWRGGARYFAALATAAGAGRDVPRRGRPRPAPRVAVVNETLARRSGAGRQRDRPHVPVPRPSAPPWSAWPATRSTRRSTRRPRRSSTSRSRRSGSRGPFARQGRRRAAAS